MLNKKEPIFNREFNFTHENFDRVVELIDELSGIKLSSRKTDMVYSRLARRLRKLGLRDFDLYLDRVIEDEEEKVNFINSLTTNLTHFFRENHHFEFLQKIYFPELFQKNQKRIRFWSAGCSTGEEPYSLSMVWQGQANKPLGIDFKILATDLDTNVLESCRRGIYQSEKIKNIEQKYEKWFRQTDDCKAEEWKISPRLREYIFFKQLNLMEEWPMKGPLDLIICRNVLIYFDKETQQNLVNRFAGLLSDNGILMLGHSENLSANKRLFTPLGKTTFRKAS
ncbi:CheR family methyltransferase [Aliikangiella coralliicola]|uniref:Chemotaxis protein methyltransferase n=1 Tax=Aliikangiella coralliicola TaxID=2592383 RepID=A0A545UBA5_9GAMM|nr:protein-glutamate O-methyltransferase CheR [Aliikangiella coralliicola]TQV86713.1 protein-glutamate O-methyltransferase CheR [Aliikangiella coralliicola]